MFSSILDKKGHKVLIVFYIQENICYTQNYIYYNTNFILF
jgi:hypothetical protein